MKGRQIILGLVKGRPAAALLVDGALDDLLVTPPDDLPRPGAIFRGIVDRPLKGQGAVIVRLPDGNGFLRGAQGLSQGAPVLVQVTGYAERGKAVPLTDRLLFKSRFAIATPGAPGLNLSRQVRDEERRVDLLEILHEVAADAGGTGVILRSLAEHGDDADIADDLRTTLDLAAAVSADLDGGPELLLDGPDAHALAWRDWGFSATLEEGEDAFARLGIDERIEALLSPRIDLPGGAVIYVEPTRALVAVDVNTGSDTSLAAGLKANIAMARALPAELRCRGLAGQVVLDVAPMPKKDRRGFEQVLKAAFRADPVETTLAGWTPLGHFELQRRRERLPLTECLA